jgi:putative tricarboxylic transport membrane protein
MRLSNQVTGSLVALLGAATIYDASRLPPMPGQQVGPAIFPIVIGGGLVLSGLLVLARVGQRLEDEAEAELAAHSDEVVAAAPESGSRLYPLRVLIPPALLLFYAVAAEPLGFVPTAAIIVFAAAAALGARVKLAVPLALLAPVVVHLLFGKLLRVALPPGLLPMPW